MSSLHNQNLLQLRSSIPVLTCKLICNPIYSAYLYVRVSPFPYNTNMTIAVKKATILWVVLLTIIKVVVLLMAAVASLVYS